jgi:hypothetical protein
MPTQGSAGAAAAPLPSASTPDGAKARVEDAMKKSEERTEGSDKLKKGN